MVDDVDTKARTVDRAHDDAETNEQAPTTETSEVSSLAARGVQLRPSGYVIKEVLGRGGMGEVLAAQDRRIGREVAYKRLRGNTHTSEALARFSTSTGCLTESPRRAPNVRARRSVVPPAAAAGRMRIGRFW